MFSLGYDLIVQDDEFLDLGTAVLSMAEAFEAKLDAYRQSLARVTAGAIKEGVVADNLVRFEGYVTGLKWEATQLARQVDKVLRAYVSEIDRADRNLY